MRFGPMGLFFGTEEVFENKNKLFLHEIEGTFTTHINPVITKTSGRSRAVLYNRVSLNEISHFSTDF